MWEEKPSATVDCTENKLEIPPQGKQLLANPKLLHVFKILLKLKIPSLIEKSFIIAKCRY